MSEDLCRIVVVIPAYRVRNQICDVINRIPKIVAAIVVVDDACPESSGEKVTREFLGDERVTVLRHQNNSGVGGAMVSGFKEALRLGAHIVVKVDGDGQMDPALLPIIIKPLVEGRADYTKGNRFFTPEDLRSMPVVRLIGNAVLSFFSKLAHGYWNVMDPTNGYVAIHADVLARIPLDKLDRGFFFENDMLFRLSILRAVVRDVPIAACYREEHSSLHIPRILVEFPFKFFNRIWKRFAYNYFIRDFTVCSVEIVVGGFLLGFGVVFGLVTWIHNTTLGIESTAGTVMLAGLPVMVGLNLLIAALNYDIGNMPKDVLHKL